MSVEGIQATHGHTWRMHQCTLKILQKDPVLPVRSRVLLNADVEGVDAEASHELADWLTAAVNGREVLQQMATALEMARLFLGIHDQRCVTEQGCVHKPQDECDGQALWHLQEALKAGADHGIIPERRDR